MRFLKSRASHRVRRDLFNLFLVLALSFSIGPVAVANASLVLTSGLGTTHAGNLVVNGSFEIPPLPDGTKVSWALGGPSAVIPGWTGGGPATNAEWGNDGPSPYRLRASDVLPDGRLGVYFENGQVTTVSPAPIFNPNGSVTFASPPTFTIPSGNPITLSQTVLTNLTGATVFKMSFWVSGEENATVQGFPDHGILGFQMSNVLPGNPIQWLAAPNGGAPYGLSNLYEYAFSPLVPSTPVTIRFFGYGHFNYSGVFGQNSTEPILDDVIINAVTAVPEPSVMSLLAK